MWAPPVGNQLSLEIMKAYLEECDDTRTLTPKKNQLYIEIGNDVVQSVVKGCSECASVDEFERARSKVEMCRENVRTLNFTPNNILTNKFLNLLGAICQIHLLNNQLKQKKLPASDISRLPTFVSHLGAIPISVVAIDTLRSQVVAKTQELLRGRGVLCLQNRIHQIVI